MCAKLVSCVWSFETPNRIVILVAFAVCVGTHIYVCMYACVCCPIVSYLLFGFAMFTSPYKVQAV